MGQLLTPTSSLIPISPVFPSWEGLGVGCLLSPVSYPYQKDFIQQTLIILMFTSPHSPTPRFKIPVEKFLRNGIRDYVLGKFLNSGANIR